MSTDASSHPQNRNLNYIIKSGLAGGVAGCVAKTVVAPLDRVKILFQASNPEFQKYAGTWSGAFHAGRKIYQENGVRGLLQGHSVTLLRVFPYAAIKFMAYDQVRAILMPSKASETNFRRFSAGSISGMISVCFTYPLEVIRVRMAFQTKNADPSVNTSQSFLLRAYRHIYAEGSATGTGRKHYVDRFPVLKFYRGFTATMVGMIPYAGVSFLSWEYLRARFLPLDAAGRRQSTPLSDLTIGAFSGAAAQTSSYPFEVIRRRMQVGGISTPNRWLGWRETISAIWRTGGFQGFYVGLSIGYLKVVPMTAVSFAVWQGGKRILGV